MRIRLIFLITLCLYLVGESLGATIFDGRPLKRGPPRKSLIPKRNSLNDIEKDTSKRHISTLRVLNSDEKEEYERRVEELTDKINDETSNERNIWRSHPQKPDFAGPDTASVADVF